MSWSLSLRNGDLALGGVSLGTCTGSQKLVQDLRCTILERMGTDTAHPGFGSLIDGGTRPDGTTVPSLIGGTDWSVIATLIEAEIRRICNDYRNRQLERARNDQFTYGHPTLSPGEVLLSVANVGFAVMADTLLVQINLNAGDGTQATLNLPIASQPVTTS